MNTVIHIAMSTIIHIAIAMNTVIHIAIAMNRVIHIAMEKVISIVMGFISISLIR